MCRKLADGMKTSGQDKSTLPGSVNQSEDGTASAFFEKTMKRSRNECWMFCSAPAAKAGSSRSVQRPRWRLSRTATS